MAAFQSSLVLWLRHVVVNVGQLAVHGMTKVASGCSGMMPIITKKEKA